MKYLGFILGAAGIYFYFFHHAPVAEVKEVVAGREVIAVTAAPPPPATPAPTNSLKRPLDRTREVLGQVGKRNGAGEF